MANDPHRAYSAPSLRYLVHLPAPGLNVIGAGEPALPGISLGHNGTIAFGLTIFNIDQEDLYVYELNPADATQYKYKDGWESFRVVKETIAVKGAPAKTVELTFTRHGPVIHIDAAKGRAYAVRSGWLEPGMSPYFGSLEYMRAKDFNAFRKALVNWGAPTLNQVYADAKGNIGWIPSGLAPKRPNWDGLLPVPGDGRYEWGGFWRGDQMPSIYNPEKGWIATANAYNIPEDYPAKERKLGFEWTNPSRHQRAHEVLGALSKVSLEDSERLQNDILSIPARRLVALLAPLSSDDEKTKRALAFLRGWDARLHADSPQAALEEIWQLRHLRKGFPRGGAQARGRGSALRHRHERDADGPGETRDAFRRQRRREARPAPAHDAQVGVGGNGEAAGTGACDVAVGQVPLQPERAPVRPGRRGRDARPHQRGAHREERQRIHPQPVPRPRDGLPADERPVGAPRGRRRQMGQLARGEPPRPVRRPGKPALPRPRAAVAQRQLLSARVHAQGG